MPEIEQTHLPGVGVRQDFLCRSGRRVGVITRPSGRRDLLVYDSKDPDAVKAEVDLSASESMALAEVLGGPQVTESIDNLPGFVAGLHVDWLPLPATFVSTTIGHLELRRRTGASVVAIIRDGVAQPAPGPDDELRAADTVVVVGTTEGVQAATARLGV